MKSQSQVQQPAVRVQSQEPADAQASAPLQAQRVRPAAPEGAAAPAAATRPAAPVPQAPHMQAHSFGDAPVDARAMVTRSAPPAHAAAHVPAHAPAPAIHSRGHERRRSPRQTLVAKAVVRSEFNQNTVATGFLSNISMLGVGFHTRRPLTIGEKFQLRLELGPMKWATRLRVVSCQPHDSGTYDVGAEFIGSDLVDRVQREPAA